MESVQRLSNQRLKNALKIVLDHMFAQGLSNLYI